MRKCDLVRQVRGVALSKWCFREDLESKQDFAER